MNQYKNFIAVLFLLLSKNITAQQSSFTAIFSASDGKTKPVVVSFSKPIFNYENPHGYWFVNLTNNYKHFNTQPDAGFADRKEEVKGVAFITFNQLENDIDFYNLNDSISVSLQQGKNVINAPTYDPKVGDGNKPMHIHINSISASEISFTLGGAAVLSSNQGYAGVIATGTISGTGHFYREAKYAKSDLLPGCNCDPTIYAKVIDGETEVRTASACEAALNHKLFDAVQKSMSKLFTDVDKTDNINISMMAGSLNINVPIKDRPYCSADFYNNGLTGLNAHKKLFTNDDRFGLRFINMEPVTQMSNANNDAAANIKIQADKMDSLHKLVEAKKITMEQYSKAVTAILTGMSSNSPDIKKLEAENNLYISIIFNPDNKTETDLKLADKNKTVVTHNIKGAAFEIFSPMVKDGDGSWVNSRQAIYFGKFSAPTNASNGAGFDVKATNATYPANVNKLSIYNIIIKMQGGKDLMDKAIANIDFNVLESLISKQ
jgi:hypothetical protein